MFNYCPTKILLLPPNSMADGKVEQKTSDRSGNIFYRSFRKLRKKSKDSTSKSKDFTEIDKQPYVATPQKPQPRVVIPGMASRQRSSSAGDALQPINQSPPSKKRPFSQLIKAKTDDTSPISKPKPDYFLDVKLKEVPKYEKTEPKTTERYKLFEGVYQVSLKVSKNNEIKPIVTWSHPPLGTTADLKLKKTEEMVPDFAFPDIDLLEKKSVDSLTETYAFVQTDMTASRMIGYCRRFKYKAIHGRKEKAVTSVSGSEGLTDTRTSSVSSISKVKQLLKIRVWCIITKLHCFDTFSLIFDEIKKIREDISASDVEVFSFLKAIGESKAPLPGYNIPINYVSKKTVDNEMTTYTVHRPGPEDRHNLIRLADLPNKLGKTLLINVMIALFTESKILVLSKKLSKLTSCLHALTSLLYPLQWECIYIPMLSLGIRKMIRDLVQSPYPYIIGMLKDDYSKVRECELKDTKVLVIDLTSNKLIDLRVDDPKKKAKLPISDTQFKGLKKELKAIKRSKDPEAHGKIWYDFINIFLNPLQTMIDATEVSRNSYSQIDRQEYLNKISEIDDDCSEFSRSLINSQMMQQYLQKKRIQLQ